jgi:bacillithiol system protein YtxJ
VPLLHNVDDLTRLLAMDPDRPLLVFKHSTRCPISAAAYAAFQEAVAGGDIAPAQPAVVRVIEDRPFARSLADRWGVAHQSPQALLVAGDRVVWHASHGAVTRAALAAAVRAAVQG